MVSANPPWRYQYNTLEGLPVNPHLKWGLLTWVAEEKRTMTVNEMAKLIEAENMTPETNGNAEVSCGYTCDLLSWVMATARREWPG